MLMKRVYRFILKRLVGPFLVNNDLAIADLDVKLRERTVQLRNLQLDTEVLNASIGLAEFKVVSASVDSLVLNGKDGFAVHVSGIRVVLEPRGPLSGKQPTAKAEDFADEDVGELDDLKKAVSNQAADGSSLSEGLNSVEGWIERSMNMLKVKISDVLVEVRLPAAASTGFPYYLAIQVDACESQTNFDAAFRQTELFGVHISIRSTESAEEKRLVYVEPSSSADDKVCLIRAALDETFKERGYEVTLFALSTTIDPSSLSILLDFYARFSQCNSGGECSSTSKGDESEFDDNEFFDAQTSMAQSSGMKKTKDQEMPQSITKVASTRDSMDISPPAKPASTVFRLEISKVSLAASFGTADCIHFAGQGVVITQAKASVNKLSCTVESENCDLIIDIEHSAMENAFIYDMADERVSLACAFSVSTSSKLRTLMKLADAYSKVSASTPKDKSIVITPSTSTSRFRVESAPELAFHIRGTSDEVIFRVVDVRLDSSGLSAINGSILVRALPKVVEESEEDGSIFLFLDKSVTVTVVDNSTLPIERADEDGYRRVSRKQEEEFEEDEDEDLGRKVTKFENSCLKMAGIVLDVCIGEIKTPDRMDPEIFQRVAAVLVSCGPESSISDLSSVEPLRRVEGLPCIRASCPYGRFSFAAAKSLPGCQVEFRDLSALSYSTDSTIHVQHLSLVEKMEEGAAEMTIPILFSSRFASDSVSSAVALMEKRTMSDMDVRVLLSNHTLRLEPRSQGLLAISTCLIPDGRGAPSVSSFRTDVRLAIENWVIDVFPSQSPFASMTEVSAGLTQARLLATVGKMQMATCETLATLKRYDVDVMDAQLYLANRSAREHDEHVYVVSRGPGLVIQEYAELNGFVRIGEMHTGQFFLRADGVAWDTIELEVGVPMLRMKTCADSLESLNGIIGRLMVEMEPPVDDTGSPRGSPRISPHSPILILARSNSVIPALDLLASYQPMNHSAVPDSELPASQLRARAANAPDSSLNAKQLQARYKKEPYLLPHVIDDYYSLGSLPMEKPTPSKAGKDDEGAGRLLSHVRTSSSDLLADFDIISASPTPPPMYERVPALRGSSNARPPRTDAPSVVSHPSGALRKPGGILKDSSMNLSSAILPSSKLTSSSAAATRKRKTFVDDEDEDDDDDDDEGVDDSMMRSVMFNPTVLSSGGNSATSSFILEGVPGQREGDGSMPPTIQLIELSEITNKAKSGSVDAQQLQASVMGLVEMTAEVEKDSNDMAESEANLYKTALLASSAALERESSASSAGPGVGEGMWYPGKLLVQYEESDGEEGNEEEEDGAARYFDEKGAGDVQVRTHHFPIPVLAKPGSFLPPQPVLAARIETGGDMKDAAIRGKVRVILRDCSFAWGLFGGNDFMRQDLGLFEPIYGIPSTTTSTFGGKAKTNHIIEDHFQTGQHQPLFSAAEEQHERRRPASRRDVTRVVEIVAERVCLLMDSFGDGAIALSLAVHDVELIDEVKASPVKKLFQHWENEKQHPRFTAEDMVRFTLDISAKNTIEMHVAFLPVRLVINQDTLELINSFVPQPDSAVTALQAPASNPTSKKKKSPPTIDVADFRAVKLKIDYYPKRVDVGRLREGKYSELVHLFSYEGMEVALKRALFRSVRGFDELGSSLAEFWAQDVLNKQIYQLLAGLSPALKNVATDMADIVLLPADVFRGKATPASLGAKAQKFAKTIVIEGCGVGKKVASAALNVLDDGRVKRLPKDMPDGMTVAAQAMTSRAKNVHHTIVAVPLTVWQREGASGALKSVIRAIPVAVIQPVLGLGEAIEAISTGIQFHVNPDDYKDESRRWKHS